MQFTPFNPNTTIDSLHLSLHTHVLCYRYLGLTALQTTNCHDPRSGHISNEEWASFVSPLALVWLYFMLWYESNMLISAPVSTEQTHARTLYHRLLWAHSHGNGLTLTCCWFCCFDLFKYNLVLVFREIFKGSEGLMTVS